MAAKILKRSEEKLKEKAKNRWNWNWLDRKVEDFRVDVIRKLDEEGVAFCISCGKKIGYGNKGFSAIENHMLLRPRHRKSVASLKQNTTIRD